MPLLGVCETFCPQEEREQRERSGRLHWTEKTKEGRADPEKTVKEYVRSGVGGGEQGPEKIRPPSVLLKCTLYLVDDLFLTALRGSSPSSEAETDIQRLEACALLLPFVCDRLRAVRQDLKRQQPVQQIDARRDALRVIQTSVAFLLVAEALLRWSPRDPPASPSRSRQLTGEKDPLTQGGGGQEWSCKDTPFFWDPTAGRKQLCSLLSDWKEIILQSPPSCVHHLSVSSLDFFWALYVLFWSGGLVGSPGLLPCLADAYSRVSASLRFSMEEPTKKRESGQGEGEDRGHSSCFWTLLPLFSRARHAALAAQAGNWIRSVRLVSSLPFLLRVASLGLLNSSRMRAVKTIRYAGGLVPPGRRISVGSMHRLLFTDSLEDTAALLRLSGMDILEAGEEEGGLASAKCVLIRGRAEESAIHPAVRLRGAPWRQVLGSLPCLFLKSDGLLEQKEKEEKLLKGVRTATPPPSALLAALLAATCLSPHAPVLCETSKAPKEAHATRVKDQKGQEGKADDSIEEDPDIIPSRVLTRTEALRICLRAAQRLRQVVQGVASGIDEMRSTRQKPLDTPWMWNVCASVCKEAEADKRKWNKEKESAAESALSMWRASLSSEVPLAFRDLVEAELRGQADPRNSSGGGEGRCGRRQSLLSSRDGTVESWVVLDEEENDEGGGGGGGIGKERKSEVCSLLDLMFAGNQAGEGGTRKRDSSEEKDAEASEGVPFYVLAVSSDTGATQALSLLTCWISGWVCASADPRESPSRLASLLENVRACVLVTGGEGARLMGRNFRFPDCRVIEGESLFFEEMDETFLSALSSVDHSASASPSLPPPVLRCTAEAVRVDRPSHVFFTSGSTGMPKGCLVGHNAVASYAAERSARQGVATVGRAAWRLCVEMKGRSGGSIVERGGEVTETEREREREREREGGRFLCVSPPSFDPSLGDVAQAWLGVCRRSGRSSCLLLPPSYPSVLGGLSSMLKDLNVTHLTTTPTLWRTLQYGSGGGLGEGGKKSGCPVLFSLQDVALGGEKMGLDIVEVFSGSRTRLWNVYGVTECAVYQTALEVQTCERGIPLRRDGMPGGETGSGPPLGKFSSASCCGLPLESVGVGTVREESGGESEEGSGVCELLPFGTVGEVILWGPQVGLGYVGLPSETRRAFVSLDIGGCGGAVGRSLNGACGRGQYVRAYRTGDLGWVDETSGELWLIGRGGGVNGDQVKVRGQRVELSEVEASCCSMFQEAEGILRDQRVREWCDQLGIRHASLFEVGGVAAVLVETGGGVAASQPSPQDPVGVEKTDVVSLGRGRGGQLGMLCCLRRVDDDDDDDARERTREAPVLSSENISQMREGGSGTSHLTSSPSSVQLPATTNRHLPACLGKALLFMCARLLPTHLRPQRVVVANADLPKTISGKVDRPSATRMFAELARQERELEETASEGGDAGGDWTETEKIVAVCWALYVGLVPEGSVDSRKKFDETMKLVCGRGMIKREDHFDQLGGDSMTALRVVRRLRGWAAGRDFPPREAGGEFGEFSGPLSPQALVELASLSLFSLFLEKNKIKLRPPQLRENEEGDETGEAVDREEKGGREKETKKKHSGRNTPPTSSQGLEENSTESVSLEEKEKGKGKEASRDGEDESKAPAPAARETTTETPEKKNRGDATADLFFSLLRSVCGKGDFLSLALLLSLRGEKWGRSLLRADSDDDLSKKLDALFPLDSQPSPSNDQRRAASPSPLHLACLGGHSLCCLLLLLSGASPSLCDARRATPLHLAAAAGPKGTACVRALLAAECAEREGMPGPLPMGPGVRSNRKKFVLAIRDESEHTVVHAAARGGSAESVELICASWMKASPPYRLTHATISASRKGEAEARGESSSSDGVSRLRTLDWRDRWGRTPVHWAVVNCQPQALAALLKCGADPDPLALPEGKARHQTSLRIERPIEVARRLSISGRSLPPPPSEEGTSVEGRFSGLVSPVAQSFVTQDGGQEREKEQVEESWQEDESKIEFARKGEEKTTANDVKSEIGDATALQADARLTAKDERRLGAEMLSVFENHAHRTR